MYIYNMKATIVYTNTLDGEPTSINYKEITARNIDSMLNKLSKIGIVIHKVDAVFMQLKAGYTDLSDKTKIKIEHQ